MYTQDFQRGANMYRYNIVVDHEDGTCNLIFSAMTPYFSSDKLTYYTYDESTRQYDQHIIDMKDVVAFSMTKIVGD